MNATVSMFNTSTPTPGWQPGPTIDPLLIKVLHGIFATLSILGNTFVIAIFLSSKSLYQQASSKFVLSLAFVDALTGVIVFISPRSILDGVFQLTPGTTTDVLCSILYSDYFFYSLGIISVYLITGLNIERCFMAIKPFRYKVVFKPRVTNFMIAVAFILGFVVNAPNLYQSHYDPRGFCNWRNLPGGIAFNRAIYFILFMMKFVLPLGISFICYGLIVRAFKISHQKIVANENSQVHGDQSAFMMRQVTIMAFITTLVYFICWGPNQIYFTLINFKVLQLQHFPRFFFVILIMINSVVNPIIYMTVNYRYRQQCRHLFSRLRSTFPNSTANSSSVLISMRS
ncbi:Rhodopsin, GQ-coupled [Trichoplax sp. H2]|nr:Rhodopsin, GQ-coupled [Trichoplax sp. H2]|eukprot:RDD43163.1 Rhodopsin, GQ-coupled [Trichoplax sp. H2]